MLIYPKEESVVLYVGYREAVWTISDDDIPLESMDELQAIY